jgi:hypothetical protein
MATADQMLMERAFQMLLEVVPDLAAGAAGGGGRQERRIIEWKQEGVGEAKHQRHVRARAYAKCKPGRKEPAR